MDIVSSSITYFDNKLLAVKLSSEQLLAVAKSGKKE